MTLPIDCIVPVYYSACVNVASTNSQSLVVNSPPILPPRQSTPPQVRVDNVFNASGFSGLAEAVSIYDNLFAARQKISTITDSVSVSDSIKRSIWRGILENISLGALVFNGATKIGTGNYVQLDSTAPFTNALTVVAWVKFINADNRGFGGVISFINGYFGNRLLLDEDAQTILFETATVSNAIVDCSYTLPGTVFSNTWHHFGVVYDGSQMQIYFDGSPVGTPVSQSGTLLSGGGKPLIGLGSSNAYFLHGNVAELALYNSALSASDISNVYNNGANTVTTNQISYYKFNEGSGHIIHDSTGSINGQIINDQLWSTDVHSPLPNPSIYQGRFGLETITRRISPFIAETISIVQQFLRKPIPFIRENIVIEDMLNNISKIIALFERVLVGDGSGYTSGFNSGFTNFPSILIKVIPKITTEVETISAVLSRKVVPKILSQIITISDLLKITTLIRMIFETVNVGDGSGFEIDSFTSAFINIPSILIKVIPKITTETISIAEVQLRKAIPKLTSQTVTVSGLVKGIRAIILLQTVTILDSRIRKALPKVTTQTTNISDSLLRKPIPKITAEITSISQQLLRKVVPKIVTQTATIIESQLRRVIPKIASETTTILGVVVGIKAKFFTLLETVTLGAGAVSKIAKHLIAESDSATISESLLRKAIPKITAQLTTITEGTIRRVIPKILTQTVTIVQTLLRRIPISLSNTTSILDALTKIGIHLRSMSDAITISESRLRKAIPSIVTAAITISDSRLRKVIPKISTSVISVLDSLLGPGGHLANLIGIVAISEQLKGIAKHVRATTDTTTISESLLRKSLMRLSESIAIVDSRLRKVIRPISTQTITISDSKVRKFIPKISTQTITLLGTVVGPIRRVMSILQTITISESRVRKVIPRIATQTATISDAIKIPIIIKIIEAISIVESRLLKIFRGIIQTITVSDSVSRQGQVQSTRTVVYTLYRDVSKTSGMPSGGAGFGEMTHRPIPIDPYIVNYEMEYRKRWKGEY